MIIGVKDLKAAISKCSAGVDASIGLTQAGKVIFVPGFIMGMGTSINVRVPCPSADIECMLDKSALDKVLSKASGDISLTKEGDSVVAKYGRSRLKMPCMPLPAQLGTFPETLGTPPDNFIQKVSAAMFPNRTAYVGVAWDSDIYPGILGTDSVRIVSVDCPGLPGKAWLPEASVAAILKAGKDCIGILDDRPYLHVQYADGTICSVLYRAAEDFPIAALAQYIYGYSSAGAMAEGDLDSDALEAIVGAASFVDAFDSMLPVQIEFAPGTVTVSSRNAGGEFCGDAAWNGEFTGRFTVDARPFVGMSSGIHAVLKNVPDVGIVLGLVSATALILLTPDA